VLDMVALDDKSRHFLGFSLLARYQDLAGSTYTNTRFEASFTQVGISASTLVIGFWIRKFIPLRGETHDALVSICPHL
jgi:hypothetical protein